MASETPWLLGDSRILTRRVGNPGDEAGTNVVWQVEGAHTVNEYTMTGHVHSGYLNKYGEVLCAYEKCGKPIKVGDEVVSRKMRGSDEYSLVYHRKCAEILNII